MWDFPHCLAISPQHVHPFTHPVVLPLAWTDLSWQCSIASRLNCLPTMHARMHVCTTNTVAITWRARSPVDNSEIWLGRAEGRLVEGALVAVRDVVGAADGIGVLAAAVEFAEVSVRDVFARLQGEKRMRKKEKYMHSNDSSLSPHFFCEWTVSTVHRETDRHFLLLCSQSVLFALCGSVPVHTQWQTASDSLVPPEMAAHLGWTTVDAFYHALRSLQPPSLARLLCYAARVAPIYQVSPRQLSFSGTSWSSSFDPRLTGHERTLDHLGWHRPPVSFVGME